MSSVLHPVGPEPPQTYWLRRAAVIGAAILALIVMIAVIVSQNSSGSVVAQPTPSVAAPSPSLSGPAPYTPTPTPTPTPIVSAGSQATNSPSSSSSATKKASAEENGSAKAEAEAKTKASATPSAKASAKAKPTGPVACPAAELRPTLTGEQKLKRQQSNAFAISLINGSGQTCTVKVGGDNFELKIYSGKDRIWSSNDCSTAVKPMEKKLAKEQAVAWKMIWDGRRSKSDCKQRPEIPKAGTYFATAQLAGAKPVQLRMIIHN